MPLITRHFFVQGRVQGVSYRVSTQRQAFNLGVTGWVRNLTDGRVEVLATATSEQIKQLEGWLWQGPEHAEVVTVEVEETELIHFANFEVASTI
ncbi:acylphosphatase [Gilvimarinus sp. SDUM040013]|uniref:acylphosphatase n=1 Tax=Gilvimarinus gilvus TaxID=3058038 RepID=A0ABU4S097_9GAMM|nr:acylphosphatase [Gilvimarinus sp. SDUM040013]MDO3388101.1 acylphosphatase [Gilvimarinus sp. SDUM040013]MDX6850324.1 acylphosphatase [Gilvimarinus sp. SDUM040013]